MFSITVCSGPPSVACARRLVGPAWLAIVAAIACCSAVTAPTSCSTAAGARAGLICFDNKSLSSERHRTSDGHYSRLGSLLSNKTTLHKLCEAEGPVFAAAAVTRRICKSMLGKFGRTRQTVRQWRTLLQAVGIDGQPCFCSSCICAYCQTEQTSREQRALHRECCCGSRRTRW